jgi:uncharacterized membrane protein YraQ (UPF0718 family)/copper chaperone CopZ
MLDIIFNIFKESVLMFLEMSPYIILGLVFVALLNYFVSKELITKHIGGNNLLSIFKAALFGIPLPLCSCGVVPTAVYMSKSGASKSATVSFLISTPQTGIDSLIATYGMMGPLFAIFRPLSALITGIAGGLAVRFFNKETETPKPKFIGLQQFTNIYKEPVKKVLSTKERILKTLNYSFVEFLDDITVQFLFGVIAAGLISYVIPNDYFANTGLNSGIGGMLIMILIGAPMYVCATASIPIAMTLMMKGFTPGVAFVFLAVGPATNAASIMIITKSLGKKVAIIYLLSISVISIIMGYLLDWINSIAGEGYIWHNHDSHNHNDMFLSYEVKIIIGIIFFIMLMLSLYRKYLSKYFIKENITKIEDGKMKINIEGMTCNHCVDTVTKTINKIAGVESVEVKLNENCAYIKGNFNLANLKSEIESVGYKVID